MKRLSLPLLMFVCSGLPLIAGDDAQISALRAQIAAQQKQIEELRKTLEAEQQLLDRLAQPPLVASTTTAAIAGALARPQPAAQAVKPATETGKASPLSFRIGEADFTPGGFMDMTSIFRSTNVGSGIGTSFGGIPFNNTAPGKITENRFSAQNSRVALKVSVKPGQSTVTGYLETDLLGNAPTNLFVSSNADTMRLRLYWLQWQRGNWEILGGQSWSMLTPGRKGISPVPSDLFYTQDMDTNYQVGLVWTRAPQFRFVYHASNGFHAGFALENPQQYVGGAVVLPSTLPANQLDNGTITATPNLHPDFQAKFAYDGKFGNGLNFHLETAGVLRSFSVMRPTLTRSTIHGGGGELNGNVEIVKNFRLLATSYWSAAGGRYLFGLGPDVIVRPDGSLSPIHSGGGIAGFEYQASAKALLYGYYGTAYFGKNFSVGADGKYVGYGFPGSSASANRSIQEYTLGYTHTFWKNPNWGAIQLINQYSYVLRAPWVAPAGGSAHAHTNMIYNNLRYVLP